MALPMEFVSPLFSESAAGNLLWVRADADSVLVVSNNLLTDSTRMLSHTCSVNENATAFAAPRCSSSSSLHLLAPTSSCVFVWIDDGARCTSGIERVTRD